MPNRYQTRNNNTVVSEVVSGRDNVQSHGHSDESGLSEEGKLILAMLTKKLDTLLLKIDERNERIKALEGENADLRTNVEKLEARVDAAECSERLNNIVISGDNVPVATAGENLSQVVTDMFSGRLRYVLSPDNILSAYRVGSKSASQSPDRRSIIVRLRDGEIKRDIMQACRTAKPNKLFVRDNLTATRSRILYVLRKIRKNHPEKIEFCGSQDGKVFVWMKASGLNTGRNQKIFINTEKLLRSKCENEFGVNLAEFLEEERQQ